MEIYQITANRNTQTLLTMPKLFPQIYTEKSYDISKNSNKTVNIIKRIKLFRFQMNPQNTFPL